MAPMNGVSIISLLVATLILTAASATVTKAPATLDPAGQFDMQSTTAQPTTSNTTTPSPTTANTTTTQTTTTTTPTPTTANTTTAHTTNTTTLAPTTENTTTPHTTNTTTLAPTTANTTTPHPANTTTLAPTTANTTTPHPANTTTPVPTTTPIPEPTPNANLTQGNYTIKNGNTLCIMVQTTLQVKVGKDKDTNQTFIVQPKKVTTSGSCNDNTASITMTFTEGFISLKFFRNSSTKMVYVDTLKVSLNYAFRRGELFKFEKTNTTMELFSMAEAHSYSCKSELVYLGQDVNLEFSQQRIQAFNFTNNEFGQTDLCKADQPNYNVAIAVGIVLLILILIVVIAYLFSRKKRTDGYQSL